MSDQTSVFVGQSQIAAIVLAHLKTIYSVETLVLNPETGSYQATVDPAIDFTKHWTFGTFRLKSLGGGITSRTFPECDYLIRTCGEVSTGHPLLFMDPIGQAGDFFPCEHITDSYGNLAYKTDHQMIIKDYDGFVGIAQELERIGLVRLGEKIVLSEISGVCGYPATFIKQPESLTYVEEE